LYVSIHEGTAQQEKGADCAPRNMAAYTEQKKMDRPSAVAYVSNPSYLGGRDPKDGSLRPAQGNR
jgi:hypothetical protein